MLSFFPHAHDRQKIEEEGVSALEFVRLAGGGCWAYGTKYAVGQMLTLVASANVVVINFGLKVTRSVLFFLTD